MKRICLLVFLAFLVGCSGVKEVGLPEVVYPNWISNRPVSSAHYIGIAKASKQTSDYQAIAKQNALADLSSEISVTLSSASIFHQIDKGETYREDYQALIQVESQKQLEGYRLVDSWESESEYWMYYQLSKANWDRITAERKQKAIAQCYSYYTLALTNLEEGNVAASVTHAVKALDAVKIYLNESVLHTDLDEPLDALCFQLLAEIQRSISYTLENGAQNQSLILMGQNKVPHSFRVFVGSANLPFKVRSSFRDAPAHTFSDTKGFIHIQVSDADVYRTDHFVQFTFDWEGLIRAANASHLVASLLEFPENVFKLNLESAMPKIFVSSSELNLGEPLVYGVLLNATTNYLKEKGFEIVAQEQADYFINITANTHRGLKTNRMHTAILQYEFEVKDAQQKVIYQRQELELKGVQASFPTAGVNAYERSIDEFKWDVLRAFLKYLEGS